MEYAVLVHVLFSGFVFFGVVYGTDPIIMAAHGVTFSADASEVTWSHAVNSRAELDRELNGSTHFLEADVSLGLLTGNEFGTLIPIMAHPPDTVSDISLETWIDTVISRNTGKGVKLDFKSANVVEPSLMILQKYSDKLNFSLWLNADILYGPIHASIIPVKYDLFLIHCHQYFPTAVHSVGWTTNWFHSFPPETWHYEWMHVRKMADVIRCFGYENHYPSFTFPVRGIFASRSIRQLQWLLGVVPGSFLTIWTAKDDPLNIEDLKQIRQSFPVDKVYYDIPEELHSELMDVKDVISYVPERASGFSTDQWMTFTRGHGPLCTSYSYISNNTIVFGKSLPTVALYKKLISVHDDQLLRVEGRMMFFSNYEERTSSLPRSHELKIVVVDISLFSKYTKDGTLDFTQSDSDVIWTAVNASELFTFRQNATGNCIMFRLDTTKQRSFQAWRLPCSELKVGLPFNDIVENGVQVVPRKNRLVLPAGPFMIGFVSSGDNHAVVHDLIISDKKEVSSSGTSLMSNVSLGLLSILFMLLVFM
ncbi:protein FAM151B [Trichonephila inaurata madagascariensis]|uniref:Protein FAM151B n=1 Tax=Trichonephila inaurata madagascariensis TaxID=2747483 RepID=A0A8X7BQC7_9ARAC|nr:protein FAM151B [Trichonephila inaurata madagascariensis]